MQKVNIAMNNEAKAPRSIRKRAVSGAIGAFLLLAALLIRPGPGQEIPRAKATAPPNQAILRHGLGGAYFVTKSLKQRYDNLVKTVRVLEAEINKGTIDEKDALQEIGDLREELAKTREALEKQKVFVSAAKVRTQSETTAFQLGKEGLLLIVASKVRIVGWDQPEVKCVLEKAVLSADDQPVDDQLKALKVVHQHRRATEEVGQTREELAERRKAQDSAPGAKPPDPKALEARRKFDEEYLASWSLFRPMQGKEIDVLRIDGLHWAQGNQNIMIDVRSPFGDGRAGSDFQRHASLTVYVPHAPRCRLVGVSGGQEGLDVESLRSSLVIRGQHVMGQGYWESEREFRIRGLHGSLTTEDVPIQRLEDVVGDVSIVLTADSDSGVRRQYQKITGDLRAWFCRADLHLEEIAGTIDVKNEFGDTLLVVKKPLAVPLARSAPPGSATGSGQMPPLLSKAHRIVSESGHIEVHFAGDAEEWQRLPLVALTECGTVRTVGAGDALEKVSFSVAAGDPWGNRRAWQGSISRRKGDSPHLSPFERPAEVLLGKDRSPGLDLISRGGSIRIVYGE